MKKILSFIVVLLLIVLGLFYFLRDKEVEPIVAVGGNRDTHGCLGPAGYGWSEEVGACLRAFEMTPDILKASKIAVDHVGPGYALTVVSFNSYEEAGAYDIVLESGEERSKQTVYIKDWKVQSVVADMECFDSPKYFAIQKSLAPNVGSDILVKYTTEANQNLPCAYVLATSDFEIKNVDAEYFLAFTNNFLVLDKGTAPSPRGLVVYDLRSRKIAFTDSYKKPVVVAGDSITYLSQTSQKPTTQNCPNLNEYTSNGLGAVIMSKVTVDLLTLNKKELGVTECMATQ